MTTAERLEIMSEITEVEFDAWLSKCLEPGYSAKVEAMLARIQSKPRIKTYAERIESERAELGTNS